MIRSPSPLGCVFTGVTAPSSWDVRGPQLLTESLLLPCFSGIHRPPALWPVATQEVQMRSRMTWSGRQMWSPWSADNGGPGQLVVLVVRPRLLSSLSHTDCCPSSSGGPAGPLLPSFLHRPPLAHGMVLSIFYRPPHHKCRLVCDDATVPSSPLR